MEIIYILLRYFPKLLNVHHFVTVSFLVYGIILGVCRGGHYCNLTIDNRVTYCRSQYMYSVTLTLTMV